MFKNSINKKHTNMDCPVCSKEYPMSQIEDHVDKCLFLNDKSERTSPKNKRLPPDRGVTLDPPTKRIKVQSCNKSSSIESPPSYIPREKKFNSPSSVSLKKDATDKSSLKNRRVPLAEKMRPTSLVGYVGQKHILNPQTVLYRLLQKGEVPSMILWGPPGCGKTSLANVIAQICERTLGNKMRFVKLSAATSGIGSIREVVGAAVNEMKFGSRTIVFMDEIHRFNKLQQDIFLPHVEAGTFTLIGATTENPSFSLNSALLSRCRVFVFEKLTILDLVSILNKAVQSMEGKVHVSSKDVELKSLMERTTSEISNVNLTVPKFLIDEETIRWLAETCDGDARIALGGLELAVESKVPDETKFLTRGPEVIMLSDIKESLKKSHMLYDRKGDEHYNMISALHKSVRASDANASLYWLARMLAGGEDPVYIARRLVRMSSEDVGLADSNALGIAVNTMHGCQMIGMPECDVLLAQCVVYLARAPKSRLMDDALKAAQKLVVNQKGPQPPVPLHIRFKLKEDKFMADLDSATTDLSYKEDVNRSYLPEGLENVDFFGEEDDE